MRRLNIRWRLTLWFGAAMLAILVVRSLWIYNMMERRLIARTDMELDIELDSLKSSCQTASNREELRHVVEAYSNNVREWEIRVLDSSSDLLFESSITNPPVPKKPSRESPRANRRYTTVNNGAQRRRVVSEEFRTPFGRIIVQVAHSMQAQLNEAWDFVAILFSTLPLVFGSAVAVGYFVSSRALNPVVRMIAAAKEFSGKRLDQRIAIPDTGDELARLALTFNEMMDRLYHAFEEMRRFTADAAHDLRTPVTALRTEVEVGLMTNKTVEEYRESMQVVLAESVHLSRLTDQLLDLCREEHGIHPDQNEIVPLNQIVLEVVEDLQVAANQKRIEVKVDLDDSCVVTGDPIRIRRVFTNLLNNAVQYASAGSRVSVSGRCFGRQVRIQVADNGPGMPPDDLAHIFERFHRVDKSRNREMGGAGLGLSICKAIVEAHGGHIAIQSQVDHGTIISVTLPAAKPLPESADDLQWRIA